MACRLLENIRLHAILVKQILFIEIDDIELDLLIGACIRDFKVKPSCMPFSVTVNAHNEIIFGWVHIHGKVQISTLEVRIEFQIIFLEGRVHSGEKPILGDANRKEFLWLMVVLEHESVQFFHTVDMAFTDSRVVFSTAVTFEGFHVGIMPWSHVNNTVDLSASECGEGLRDHVNCGVHEN